MEKRNKMRRQETAHTTEMLRHRRATVPVADAGRRKFRISEGRATGISQLKGKHCSYRLQCYNMPTPKERKKRQ